VERDSAEIQIAAQGNDAGLGVGDFKREDDGSYEGKNRRDKRRQAMRVAMISHRETF
jgi:hypothetical protein